MSALGDYIHLHAKNYTTYGISKKGEEPNYYKPINNFLKNRVIGIPQISENSVKILEQRLINNIPTKINEDKQRSANDFQSKIDKLYEIIASRSSVEAIQSYLYGSKGIVDYSKNEKDLIKTALSRGEIEKRKAILNQINLKISEINKKQMTDNQEISELINLYQQAGGTKNFSKTGNKSILGQLQDAINEISYNTWISAVSGEFGEHLVALCGDKVEQLATNELESFLTSAVIGGERSSIKLDKNKVAKDLSSFLSTDKEGNSYYLGTTQDKVDVKIDIKGEEILANVKHYYDADKVTLQSKVSLFSSLAFLEKYNQFGTHWLNMHSGSLKGARVSADKTLKEEIAYEALVSGNPLKKVKGANTFVFIDRKTGRIFVKQTKDILTQELNRINITPNISGLKFKNRYSKKYQDRITNILMQAHATQLYVSMTVSANGT